jgi:ABC-type Fe3+ transport system permease subunit
MTWQPPGQPAPPESKSERDARLAWERGGSSLVPPVGRLADRVVTVLLLAFGALLTILAAIAGIVAAVSATSTSDGAAGAVWGSVALGVGAAFIIGVASMIGSIAVWIRRRTSWWIAAVGFVLATACVAVGAVLFVHAVDGSTGGGARTYLPGGTYQGP